MSSSNPKRWKLSATRKVTSTSTLSSIFNPRKPLNMIGNNKGNKNKEVPKKSMSSYSIQKVSSPMSEASSSGYSSSLSSAEMSKNVKKNKMVKSKSESEVISKYQRQQQQKKMSMNLDSSFEEEDFEPELNSCGFGASLGQKCIGQQGKDDQKKQNVKKDKKLKKDEKMKKDVLNIDDLKFEELKSKWSKDVAKAKRSKYSSASSSLRDFKSSASLKLTSVKNSIDYIIAQKLRLTSPKAHGLKNPMYQYGGLENEPPTPVKMYSPFSIESPISKYDVSMDTNLSFDTPIRKEVVNKQKKKKTFGKKINPNVDRLIINPMAFASPTGKLHEDVASITKSMNELEMMSKRIKMMTTNGDNNICPGSVPVQRTESSSDQ